MRYLLILVCSVLAAPALCSADRIIIQTLPGSSFSGGRARVDVSIVNKGDEPAESVVVQATLKDHSSESKVIEVLETNTPVRVSIDLGAVPELPGTYTVLLATRYTDRKGYPFTALSSVPLITAEPGSPETSIMAALLSPPLVRRAKMRLRLASRAKDAVDAKVTLFFPQSLECANNVSIKIPPEGETNVFFEVSNLFARPPARIPVLAVVDYEESGQHCSTTAAAGVNIRRPWLMPAVNPSWWKALAVALILAVAAAQVPGVGSRIAALMPAKTRIAGKAFPIAVLGVILAFTLYHIPPAYLFLNTTTVGGDTPAHLYLASHLRHQLLSQGRIVSWSGGWWCGFPVFQFYFCLPYLLAALLSAAMPLKVAFKIVCVAGILLLPGAAYVSARLMKLRRPGPVLLALATVPLLFDNTHTMWGVNIYSTFAGMISNSISFPIMLLFIGSASRDLDDNRFRVITVGFLVLLIASHFFTSIVAGLTVLALPFLRHRSRMRRAALLLTAECCVGLLLMAWWLVPLVVKRRYSVDFGTNWDVSLWDSLPKFVIWTLPLAAVSLLLGAYRRSRFVALTAWMLMVSSLLFLFGFKHVSPVFVNVRLWPFMIYGVLALAAAGAGLLISDLKARTLGVAAAAVIALAFGPGKPNHVWHWAEWNFRGLEARPHWPVLEKLVLPLSGTPGRLANDLSEKNESLGSSRVFECVPYITGKPILEGGLVNSAVGSLFSYYIQSETSPSHAGLPPMVRPAAFNPTNATRHLKLFNVKHFIARSIETQKALSESEDWRLADECRGWQLYELLTHDGNYVFIPRNHPVAVRTEDPKQTGLDWIYTIEAIDRPYVLLDAVARADDRFEHVLSTNEFLGQMALAKQGRIKELAPSPIPIQGQISEESVTDSRIKFRTTAIGMPHIIKSTYYPSWKVRGADRIYMVTPFFMLVYPNQPEVELYYGRTLSDNLGRGVSLFGITLLAWIIGLSTRLPGRNPKGMVDTDEPGHTSQND